MNSTPTAKDDAQSLVDELLPFAKRMLGEYREFLPYGGHMRVDGEIVHEGATTGEERSKSQPLIDILRDAHREQARMGSIRAACIVYDMRIVPPKRTEKQDAIAFELDHRDDYSGVAVYPYTIDDSGAVCIETPFGFRGQGDIFPSYAINEEAEQAAT